MLMPTRLCLSRGSLSPASLPRYEYRVNKKQLLLKAEFLQSLSLLLLSGTDRLETCNDRFTPPESQFGLIVKSSETQGTGLEKKGERRLPCVLAAAYRANVSRSPG